MPLLLKTIVDLRSVHFKDCKKQAESDIFINNTMH